MAVRIHSVQNFLSKFSLVKLSSPFSTSAIVNTNKNDENSNKEDLVPVNYKDGDQSRSLQVGEKLDDELIPRIQENLSYLGGIPQEHVVERLARIAKAPKNAMQSGTDNTQAWILQFDNRQRWENNLMGWVSTGDPLSNLQLRFNTAEDAVDYCKRYRYPYFVVKETPKSAKKKSYANIFSWNKRTRSSTK